VWRATGKEQFMFYASNNEWFNGEQEAMEAGKASGFMSVASSALTPDKITVTWQTVPGWKDAPKVSTRVYTAEEARQRAMANAEQARRIKLEGLEEDDPMQILMSVYELEEGKEVNARGVWGVTVHTPSDEDLDVFMFYAGNNMWCLDGEEGVVCAAENEEQGEPMMYVASSALTPDKITGTWQRLSEDEDEYIDEPNVRARVYTGPEDPHLAYERSCAEAERLEPPPVKIVGHDVPLKPFDSRSTTWYCDRDSPRCDRESNSELGRYLGVRWSTTWAGGSFDLCAECTSFHTCPTQGTCPQGHALQQFQTKHGGYSCDLCGRRRIAAGSTLHGCRTCDFDVCPGCL
jgi:hypothetical protein